MPPVGGTSLSVIHSPLPHILSELPIGSLSRPFISCIPREASLRLCQRCPLPYWPLAAVCLLTLVLLNSFTVRTVVDRQPPF